MIRLYMDHHIDPAIIRPLRERYKPDILTALQDGMEQAGDADLLRRAAELGRVVFTQDTDFHKITSEFQKNGTPFAGVIFVDYDHYEIGQCIEALAYMGIAGQPEDFANRLVYIQDYY